MMGQVISRDRADVSRAGADGLSVLLAGHKGTKLESARSGPIISSRNQSMAGGYRYQLLSLSSRKWPALCVKGCVTQRTKALKAGRVLAA